MIRIAALCLAVFFGSDANAQGRIGERFITLSSTTSTEESGLFGHIIPVFRTMHGISVRVVAVGTGQALAIGERGDADALLVHDRAGEDRFVASLNGIDRRDVMHNDFIIVGPKSDPAGIRAQTSAREALARISATGGSAAGGSAAGAVFASRGDDSGTHRMELRLWKSANLAPNAGNAWYREVGQGMGPTLNIAAGLNDQQILDAMIKEYGPLAYVEPPKTGFGLIAWVMPVFYLLAGLGVVVLIMKRWRKKPVAVATAPGLSGVQVSPELLARAREQARRETED